MLAFNRSDVLQDVTAKKIGECALQQHRKEGRVSFLAACPECRAGALRQRAHRRQAQHLRPGGDLRVDLSGPHVPGRWPSGLADARSKRALCFMLGAFQVYSSDDLDERIANEAFAEHGSRTAPHGKSDDAVRAAPPMGRVERADSADRREATGHARGGLWVLIGDPRAEEPHIVNCWGRVLHYGRRSGHPTAPSRL